MPITFPLLHPNLGYDDPLQSAIAAVQAAHARQQARARSALDLNAEYTTNDPATIDPILTYSQRGRATSAPPEGSTPRNEFMTTNSVNNDQQGYEYYDNDSYFPQQTQTSSYVDDSPSQPQQSQQQHQQQHQHHQSEVQSELQFQLHQTPSHQQTQQRNDLLPPSAFAYYNLTNGYDAIGNDHNDTSIQLTNGETDHNNSYNHNHIQTNIAPIKPPIRRLTSCTFPNCQKQFTRRSDLSRHMRIHSGEKPYVCEYAGCGKAFIQRSALTVHRRIHSGERPHKCQHPGCDMTFSDSSSLARHRRVHSGTKPHACPYTNCGKRFTRKTTLTRHVLIHERNSQNDCPDNNCNSIASGSGSGSSGSSGNSGNSGGGDWKLQSLVAAVDAHVHHTQYSPNSHSNSQDDDEEEEDH